MLTDADVEFIRANRADIKQHRTESVIVEHTDGRQTVANVIWSEPRVPNGSPARAVGDYSFDNNDYQASFDPEVGIYTALKIWRHNQRYILTDIDARGLGGLNRYECRLMLAVTDGQSITVKPSAVDDGWGQPIELPSFTLDCFVQEETRTVANQYGEEAVVQLRIVLEGLARISYRDKIRYVNEIGVIVEREPVRIAVKRRVDGTPLITEVFV